MKVTKGKPIGFCPLTLEIHTKEEAKVLWDVLNNSGDIREYRERYGRNEGRAKHVQTEMWCELHKVQPF